MTSCEARNSPKQGWVKNPMLIVGTPPEQHSLHLFDSFIEKRVSAAGEGCGKGALGSLLLPFPAPSDAAPAPALQTPLGKSEAPPFLRSPFYKQCINTSVIT